jgi:uncharacterized membrane protein
VALTFQLALIMALRGGKRQLPAMLSGGRFAQVLSPIASPSTAAVECGKKLWHITWRAMSATRVRKRGFVMDAYTVTKYLHVALAMIWLGGGLCLVLLGSIAERARNDQDLLSAMKSVVTIAPRVFVPGAVLVLLSGLLMVWLGGLAWDAWNILGLLGVLVTASVGAVILTPLAERAVKLAAEGGGQAEALACGKRLLRVAKADYVLQFTIVYAMVAKPGWQNVGSLTAMAAIVAAGALYFLRGGAKSTVS